MTTITTRQLLVRRRSTNSTPGNRADDAHIALVLEGGGMRGVVSVAMASAFEERGLLSSFDSLHGSSAGACGAAYFAAGQAAYGSRIYFEDINNSTFIDLFRPLRGRAVMNKEFLVDVVMRTIKPLNAEEIIRHKNFLHVVATDAKSGEGEIFSEFSSTEALFDTLRATICLPIIAGHSSRVGRRMFVDGGIAQQLAVESALKSGATHVIVLMTRRTNENERSIPPGFQPDLAALRLCYGRSLEQAYRLRNPKINALLQNIAAGKLEAGGRMVAVEGILRPSASVAVDRLTVDRELLYQAYLDGRASAFEYLDAAN